MKWFLTIFVAVTISTVTIAFSIRDRAFESYDGAFVGQRTGLALEALESKGWTEIGRERPSAQCPRSIWLTQLASPDFSVEIVSNHQCEVERIERRLRNLEL